MTGRGAAPPPAEPGAVKREGAAISEPPRAAAKARTPAKPDAPAQPTAPEHASPTVRTDSVPARAAAGAAEPASFIPDDLDLGYDQLPADFWESPSEPAAGPDRQARTTTAPQGKERNRPAGPAAATPPPAPPSDEDVEEEPPTPLEAAFNELQRLFPGRVVEVLPQAAEPAPDADEKAPLDDGFLQGDGYDDDDQARLTFGPDGDA